MTAGELIDPDPIDEHHPESIFPGAGERMDDATREEALLAEPRGNATVGDMVDMDLIDSRAHESGPGAQEVDDQVHGGRRAD
jgi:hypothetical protein